MKEITNITDEQREQLLNYMEKWKENASGETNYTCCHDIIMEMYKHMEIKNPPIILHLSSPSLVILAASLLGSQLYSQLYSQLRSQLYSQLRSQLGSQLGSQLDSQLGSQLYSQLDSQLGNQLGSQLYSQLGSQLDSQLYSQLDSQLRNQLGSHYITVWWGTWACYYEYAHYLGVKFDKTNYELFVKFVASIHSCSPYEKVFIYSNKPTICSWKGTRLHNESGMAVEYADGWGWYALNGVVMRPEYVLTPPEKITPEMVLKEENVDQRRELLRKIGVERMVSHGKIIDKNNGYQLIDLSPIMNLNYAPYLLMKNPSVDDTHHLEGVGVECKTVQEAINWRGGNISIRWEPYQLS